MPAPTTSRLRLRSALPAAVVAALTLLLALAGTSAQATSSPPATHSPPAADSQPAAPPAAVAGHAPTAPAVGADPDAPLVVIGVAGLSWSDLSEDTPTLAGSPTARSGPWWCAACTRSPARWTAGWPCPAAAVPPTNGAPAGTWTNRCPGSCRTG